MSLIIRSPHLHRPSPGHGALAHWTPNNGWVVCLGPGWGKGSTKLKYGKDVDFLEHTKARESGERFLSVLRARWISDIIGGERKCFGLSSLRGNELDKPPSFWNTFALYLQRSLAEMLEGSSRRGATARATIDLFSSHASTHASTTETIDIDESGNIIIPACATCMPDPSANPSGNDKIIFMRSILGGKQLHYSRLGPQQSFVYRINVPIAGTYALTAHVVTPSWKQSLLLSVNGSEELIVIPLPFTIGMWQTTQPLNLELHGGSNTFTFSRNDDAKGITIKYFKLELMDWCLD